MNQNMKKTLILILLTLALCAIPSQGFGAIAYVATANCGATSGSLDTCTTGSANMTGVNLLVACVGWGGTGTPAISDTSSNSYTGRTSQADTFGVSVKCYDAQGATVTSSMTFTVTTTGSQAPSLIVMGFSGALTSSGFDQTNGSSPGSGVTSVQPGSITPSVNGEVLIDAQTLTDGAQASISIDSGFSTPETVSFSGGNHYGVSMAYFIQSTAAAINPTESWTTSANAANRQYSYKPASTPAGTGYTTRRGIITR